ncbi:MAG: cytidine deaminase [Defluviitaleaceae bacterium]|nr:cytidine deaminase [Defluviitaleaceae bacterium]
MDYKELIKLALSAKEKSYSPYSNFQVGAALLTKEGKVYTGTNIENAAYTPTNCAERTAFFKAVSEGEREFNAIAVCGSLKGSEEPDYCYPCGVCRQVMIEFCDKNDFEIIVIKDLENYKVYKLKELLPFGFSPLDLQ